MIVPRLKRKNKKNKNVETTESSDDDHEDLAIESDYEGQGVVGENILAFADEDQGGEDSEDSTDVEDLLMNSNENVEGDVTDSFDSDYMNIPPSPTIYLPGDGNELIDGEDSDEDSTIL